MVMQLRVEAIRRKHLRNRVKKEYTKFRDEKSRYIYWGQIIIFIGSTISPKYVNTAQLKESKRKDQNHDFIDNRNRILIRKSIFSKINSITNSILIFFFFNISSKKFYGEKCTQRWLRLRTITRRTDVLRCNQGWCRIRRERSLLTERTTLLFYIAGYWGNF